MRDQLNAAVTDAITRARNHDQSGAKLWDRVAECEQAIADCPEMSDDEREIGRRGALTAQIHATVLREGNTASLVKKLREFDEQILEMMKERQKLAMLLPVGIGVGMLLDDIKWYIQHLQKLANEKKPET